MFSGAGPRRMRPGSIVDCEPWQGQNQPPKSPCWPSGTQPRCVQTPHHDQPLLLAGARAILVGRRRVRHRGWRCARADPGARRAAHPAPPSSPPRCGCGSTTGLPRHMTVIDWPGSIAGDVDLGGGERQRRGVRVHLVDERPERRGGADGGEGAGGDEQEIAPGRRPVPTSCGSMCLAPGAAVMGWVVVSQILPLAFERRSVHRRYKGNSEASRRPSRRRPILPPAFCHRRCGSVQPSRRATATCRKPAHAAERALLRLPHDNGLRPSAACELTSAGCRACLFNQFHGKLRHRNDVAAGAGRTKFSFASRGPHEPAGNRHPEPVGGRGGSPGACRADGKGSDSPRRRIHCLRRGRRAEVENLEVDVGEDIVSYMKDALTEAADAQAEGPLGEQE